jgi:hypothetical protein
MITLLATGSPSVLAESDFGDNVPNGVAGPLGLFITLLLVIATVLLIRNMNKRLRRLPTSFGPPAGEKTQAGEKPRADTATAASDADAEGSGAPREERTAP